MTNQDEDEINYRFSGYQLPSIKLDATGSPYYIVDPHPYYSNQPLYWQKPFWKGMFPSTMPKATPELDPFNKDPGLAKLYRPLKL